MNRTKIAQYDSDRYGMSVKCNKCEFALYLDDLPEEALTHVEAAFVGLIPLRHACPLIKGEQK